MRTLHKNKEYCHVKEEPKIKRKKIKKFSSGGDLNACPSELQSDALPLSYQNLLLKRVDQILIILVRGLCVGPHISRAWLESSTCLG